MIYKVISNKPVIRRKSFFPFIWWNEIFSNEEIEKIKSVCDVEKLEKSTTIGNTVTEGYRESEVKFINVNDNTQWIFEKFNDLITKVNNEYYNFDLNGYDKFQYTVYRSEVKGQYDWHMDTVMHNGSLENFDDTRKLTCVMLLSEPNTEFTGGEFQINTGNQDFPSTPEMKKGTIVVFPSFMIHKVKPVLLGVRKSIVIWVEGPKFR